MAVFKPKFITFDCYGTLINFDMAGAASAIFADRVSADQMLAFTTDFARYRMDEVLGAWKPYGDVVCQAMIRTCKKWGVEYKDSDGAGIMEACATWGPHPDVPAGLAKVAKEFPLVLLSNTMNDLITYHVPRLGAPIHRVFTAEQAQSYKPRMRGFEYMLDELGCGPARHPARLFQPALRPDDRPRYGYQQQSVGQPWPRSGQPGVRLYRN